ncbi:MAG TPA: hypothetical protein VK212_03030 [Lentimicrobium sp.]|nr:hypothetical protein [Lentimicrobium sp.]
MKHCKNPIILIVLILAFAACKKADEPAAEKKLPVEWLLSAQDKKLFDAFSNNMLLNYSDAGNNILTFKADSIITITTYRESNLDKGEALFVKYNCLSACFTNYSYSCRLSAKPDQTVDLSILFEVGTYWNNHNDYVPSWFLFNPNDPTDTLTYFGEHLNILYSDSVSLRDTTFFNVFLDSNLIINSVPEQTIKCWYTVDDGIVAFENNDGNLWIRK